MKKIIVPKDIRKKAVLKMVTRFVLMLILMIPAYIVADYAIRSMYEDANFGNISFTLAFIYVMPFIFSGFPRKLFDSDWYGEIISFEIKNARRKDNAGAAGIKETALIKSPTGKLYNVRIYDDGELYHGRRQRIYNVGDKVIHVYGMDYITPIRHESSNSPVVCVFCGNKSPNGTEICRHCGCSLEVKVKGM